jgi:glycosyltransferase involved in cell wall biosynthesis
MESLKKILFIVNVDWFFISHRLPIALKAKKMGYEVHLICRVTNKSQYLEELGIKVHPLSFARSGMNVIHEVFLFFKLYQKLKDIKPDIVHAVTIKPVIYGGIAAKMAKVPALVSAISGLGFLFVNRSGVKSKFFRFLTLILYRLPMSHRNQRVIFQNSTDRDILKKCSIDETKARFIRGSGVDINSITPCSEPDGELVIVMASRLLKDKGVVEFINAARLIKKKGLKVRFQLIGEPDLDNPKSVTDDEYKSWCNEKVVECLGYRSDVTDLFSKAHIVTLPSYYGEGLPKVLIEAAACGRPIITTDMPGCRDAIEPNVSGLLVPAHDAVALSKAIEELIENKELRQKMGEAGRKLAEKEYDINIVVDEHLSIYKELLNNI